MIKENSKIFLLKIFYIVVSVFFVIPSVLYFIKYKTILEFNKEYNFLLNDVNRIVQTCIYVIIVTLLVSLYYFIIKNRNKMFKNMKSLMIFILVVSSIYVFTIPISSSDVFYYMGVGRLNSSYNQNPYYVSIDEYINKNDNNIDINSDTVLKKGYLNYWGNTTVVYGPIWTIICSIVAKLSLGNVDIGLLVFKVLYLIIHMLNCYFFYKISKKKMFVVAYGLNPFILIEGIVNVHNDIFVILFILVAFYFLIKKKNLILSILFISMSVAIKYFAIILLPFLILYNFRKEKPGKRFYECIKYGIIFAIFVSIPYLFYMRDITVLDGIRAQSARKAKSLYILFDSFNLQALRGNILCIYIYYFTLKNINSLFNPKIKISSEMKSNFYFILFLIFIILTNLQPWYIMWLMPFIIYQKGYNAKLIIKSGLISMYSNTVFFIYGESWKYGKFFYLSLIICMLASYMYDRRKEILKKIKNKNKNLEET